MSEPLSEREAKLVVDLMATEVRCTRLLAQLAEAEGQREHWCRRWAAADNRLRELEVGLFSSLRAYGIDTGTRT